MHFVPLGDIFLRHTSATLARLASIKFFISEQGQDEQIPCPLIEWPETPSSRNLYRSRKV